jgi:SPP1 family predicted phage head-tail adaptor
MDAGQLTERVTLRRKVQTQDEYGTLVETDGTLAIVWAHVKPLSGRERDRGQQTEGTANYVITIRYRAGLATSDYVVWRDQQMNLRFIRDDGPRSLWLRLECELGSP